MIDLTDFLDNFLQHEYDPVKAREYYLRTRKLKGRKKGTTVNPRSKVDAYGKPLKPLGNRIEEDETPDVSPTGARLVDYDGKGLGKATYADGTVYNPAIGWRRGGLSSASVARDANNRQRTKSGLKAQARLNPRRRIGAAEQRLIRAKSAAGNIDNPNKRASALKRISSIEKKLKTAIAKNSPSRRGLRE